MNKVGFSTYAANFAPNLFQIRRSTWISIGLGLLVLFGLLIWAAVTLIGWVLGQAQSLAGAAPQSIRDTAQNAVEQVKKAVPGAGGVLDQFMKTVPDARGVLDQAGEKVAGAGVLLGEIVPSLKTETPPQREVSGQDLGPVERFSGLQRTQWQRTEAKAAVEYEGKAVFVEVLDYYAKGFASAGFAQSIQSSSQESETHDYTKGGERFTLKITQKTRNGVSVRIETNAANSAV